MTVDNTHTYRVPGCWIVEVCVCRCVKRRSASTASESTATDVGSVVAVYCSALKQYMRSSFGLRRRRLLFSVYVFSESGFVC
jgi:hypothetical protein